MRRDIRTKMILVIGLPTVAILITAFILSLLYFRAQSYEDARSEISRQAARYAARFDDYLKQAALFTNVTASMVESTDEDSFAQIQNYLERNLEANPWLFGSILAITPEVRTHDGDLFAPYTFRSGGAITTMNLGRTTHNWLTDPNYEWFHGPASDGKPRWTAPYFDEGAGNVLLTAFTRPIFRGGQFVGVSTAALNLSHLDARTRKALGLPLQFVIVANDGRYIYTADEERILGGSFLEDVEASRNERLIASTHKALAGGTGASRARWHIDGELKIMAYAPIPSTGWSYITYVPQTTATKLARGRMVIPTIVFLIALGLVIWSILSTSRKLARPIIDLSAKVLQVADGDLEAKAQSTNSNDEIGDLARSFNRMTDDLRNQVTHIAEEESRRIEADEANRAKSQFLSHMSHELRTPLNGVLGYAQIMQRDGSITGSQRRNLDGIVNCGDHLLALINDVLDLSKIEAGREDVNRNAFDLAHLLRGVSDIVSERARRKSLPFTVDVSAEVPQRIISDKSKMRQILVNLCGNAVKFTTEGSVTLRVQEAAPGMLEFSIIDTGPGISAEHLEAIFDPFKQAEGGKTAGGTGLGLAISRQLAQLLGGDIQVTSTIDKGSTFTFTLPFEEVTDDVMLAEDDDPATGIPPLRLAPGQNVTVLVADDGPANRDIMQQMLEDTGFTVLLASDGDEALTLLRQVTPPPQLALLDVRMPRVNGIEAMQEIRATPALQDMKVIAVTASVFPDFRAKALSAGFDDFIGKPFRLTQLINCLKQHLAVDFINDTTTAPPTTTSNPGSAPPRVTLETVIRLRDAIKIRSLTQLNAIARELKSSPATETLANEITDLISKFDFNALEARVEALSNELTNPTP